MEPIFENRYYNSQAMLTEFFRKYSLGPRPPMVAAMAVIFACFIIGSCVYRILPEMLPMLLFMGVIFTLLFFLPDWFAWNTLRNTKKQYDGLLPETTVTFGDVIEVREGMVQYTIEYRRIVRAVHLKHSYVLMIGKRNGILLDLKGFSKGTFEECKQFLREKRPDISFSE